MVKETVIYTTTDGKEYKTKKSAERHENELVFKDTKLTIKQVTEHVAELAKTNRIVDALLKSKPDWRDWSNHMVKQLPLYIEKMVNDVVNYEVLEVSRWYNEPKVLHRVEAKREKGGKIPKELKEYLKKLVEDNPHGTTFTMELYEEKVGTIRYKLVAHHLTPEQKMAKGIRLQDKDLEVLVQERVQLHEVQGEDRRWTRTMTTVIQAEDGNKYAIEWEQGLTENQENQYYEQPKKVELTQRPITTIVTEIEYL